MLNIRHLRNRNWNFTWKSSSDIYNTVKVELLSGMNYIFFAHTDALAKVSWIYIWIREGVKVEKKCNQLKYSYDKVEGRGELGGKGVVGRRRRRRRGLEGVGKPRNSKVKLMWWWVGGWYERIFETGRLRRPCQLLMPSLSDGSQGEDKILSMKYFFFRSEITVVSMGSPRFPWTPPATTSWPWTPSRPSVETPR